MAELGNVNRNSPFVFRGTEQAKGTERHGMIGDENGSLSVKKGEGRPGGGSSKGITFFANVKAKFSGLIKSLKEAHAARVEHRAQKQAEAKVQRWERSTVNLSKANILDPNSQNINSPAQKLLDAREVFGGRGMHKVAAHLIADAQNQAREINNKGGNTTWQQVLETRMTLEMLGVGLGKTTDDAKANLEKLMKHCVTYEQVPNPGDHGELAGILRNVLNKTGTADPVIGIAKDAFTSEIDHEMEDLNKFFRNNNLGSISTGALMRNLNAETNAKVIGSFVDVLTDPKNEGDLALANGVIGKPSPEEMQAITRLSEQVLDKAFGLGVDGGKAFVGGLDQRVVDFLKDTSDIIQSRAQFDKNTRNDAVRTWASNGLALRDFAPTAAMVSSEMGFSKAGTLVSTMILRIFGNVNPNGAQEKLGENNIGAYRELLDRRGPQVAQLIRHLGLPIQN